MESPETESERLDREAIARIYTKAVDNFFARRPATSLGPTPSSMNSSSIQSEWGSLDRRDPATDVRNEELEREQRRREEFERDEFERTERARMDRERADRESREQERRDYDQRERDRREREDRERRY